MSFNEVQGPDLPHRFRPKGRAAAAVGSPRASGAAVHWLALAVCCLGANRAHTQTGGEAARPMNLAPFGYVSIANPARPSARKDASTLAQERSAPVTVVGSNVLLAEWAHPRAVRTVRLRFAGLAPAPDQITLEWWRRIWPDNGEGGWMKLDDPFNGKWTRAHTTAATNDGCLELRMAPLESTEAPGIKHAGADCRLTYKLRLSCKRSMSLTHLGIHSDAVERRARLRFEWDLKAAGAGRWTPAFEMRNGRLLRALNVAKNAAVIDVEYGDAPERLSADRGYVVCRGGETRSFSVFVDDVLREGTLLVRDIGVRVSNAGLPVSLPEGAPLEEPAWKAGTVAEQVERMPEQSFEQLGRAIRPKPARYLFLGVPNLRQEIAVLPKGEVQMRADSLRSPGPDREMRVWTWEELTYDFASGEHPIMGPGKPQTVTRSLEEGWMPVVRHAWTEGETGYAHTCLAAPLVGDIAALQSTNGTETVVAMSRLEFTNHAAAPRTCWLWLELSHSLPCRLGLDGLLLLDHPSDGFDRDRLAPVRGRFNTRGRGTLDLAVLEPRGPGSYNPGARQSAAPRQAVRYRLELGPHEGHAIEFFAPYVELLEADEVASLKSLSFDKAHESVTAFWRERVGRGMTCEVPELYLNELFKANLWHVLISTDIDPVTGHHQHGAATHQYPNFLNETAMVARSLEMRGEHEAAFKLFEPFLANQGVKALPGNFITRDGVLYAAHGEQPDPYTAQGYNMHQGWGMWAAAEHYRWTRDQEFIQSYAPHLARAAAWIARERRATQHLQTGGSRPVEYGLAPAGDLEDVEEYLYYYATDAYYHLGMKQVAAAFALAAQAKPPPARTNSAAPGKPRLPFADAARQIGREADRFAQDIRASVAESVATSPVVRLRDGTYAPFVPSRAYALTHLKEGWIREGLYPALHLVNGEVYDARHPFVDWMIQDLEDNIFLSRESGYGVEGAATNFFSLGGFTLQPNLLDLALVYLQRDQTPNFLRAFYNACWASLYPDVACFAEWVPRHGEGGGPLYKTPDECKFIQWMRQMLVLERGDALELGLGVPRAWMTDGKRIKLERAATFFGKLDLEITSHASTGGVRAVIRLAPLETPKAVRLRLRHPEGKPLVSARVNGKPTAIDGQRQLIELPVSVSAWEVEAGF